ncbi:hypothetical protein EBZ02_09375, partial [bacterium]|nr:hypothetical protein [bacterium]
MLLCLLGVFVAPGARAQLIIERTVAVNQTITDRGQYVSTIVWANTGLSSISRVAISFSFSSADVTRPMILGQFYGSLTYGTASEEERMAQLFSPTNALSGFTPTYTVESALDGPRLASDTWSVLVSDQVKGGGAAVWNSWKLTVEGIAAESGIFRPGASGRLAVSASESTAQVGAALELENGGSVAA